MSQSITGQPTGSTRKKLVEVALDIATHGGEVEEINAKSLAMLADEIDALRGGQAHDDHEPVFTRSQWDALTKPPSEIVLVDADGELVGRMRTEARAVVDEQRADQRKTVVAGDRPGCPGHPRGTIAGCGPCATARRRFEAELARAHYESAMAQSVAENANAGPLLVGVDEDERDARADEQLGLSVLAGDVQDAELPLTGPAGDPVEGGQDVGYGLLGLVRFPGVDDASTHDASPSVGDSGAGTPDVSEPTVGDAADAGVSPSTASAATFDDWVAEREASLRARIAENLAANKFYSARVEMRWLSEHVAKFGGAR